MNSSDKKLAEEIFKSGQSSSKFRPSSSGEARKESSPGVNSRFNKEGKFATAVGVRESSSEEIRLLTDLGTTLWRMQKVVMEADNIRPRRGMKLVARHLAPALDALRQHGVRIQDHTGCKFDTGQSLAVLAFQPTAGLTYEVVLDTIKPTIYLKGKVIQMGEVIVGIPEKAFEVKSTSPTPSVTSNENADNIPASRDTRKPD